MQQIWGRGGRCRVCIAYCMLESSGAIAPSTNSKEAEFNDLIVKGLDKFQGTAFFHESEKSQRSLHVKYQSV